MCSQLTADNGIKEEGWPVLLGSLLHKKDDRQILGNYRLLAILDSDLRWRSRALLDKLMPQCQNFLSEEQTAFIKGRHIVDNVMAGRVVVGEKAVVATKNAKKKSTAAEEGIVLGVAPEKRHDCAWRGLVFAV